MNYRNLLPRVIDNDLTGWKIRLGWSILCTDELIVISETTIERSPKNIE